MHIDKNVCDNLIRMLIGFVGKGNDNLNARLDFANYRNNTITTSRSKRIKNVVSPRLLYPVKIATVQVLSISEKFQASWWILIEHFTLCQGTRQKTILVEKSRLSRSYATFTVRGNEGIIAQPCVHNIDRHDQHLQSAQL